MSFTSQPMSSCSEGSSRTAGAGVGSTQSRGPMEVHNEGSGCMAGAGVDDKRRAHSLCLSSAVADEDPR